MPTVSSIDMWRGVSTRPWRAARGITGKKLNSPVRRPSAAASSATGGARVTYSGGTNAVAGSQAIAAAAAAEAVGGAGAVHPNGDESAIYEAQEPVAVQQRRVDETEPGRNDPCWCGSGKKYKKCHGA